MCKYSQDCFPLTLLCFVCLFYTEAVETKKSKSTFEPFFVPFLCLFFCDCVFKVVTLPYIVTCPPQSPARCCPPWSFSAWQLSWESQQLFGSCTRSTILAPQSLRHSSTTLRSESWKRTSPAWWRLRRLTACRSRTFSVFHNRKYQALITGWVHTKRTAFMQKQLQKQF